MNASQKDISSVSRIALAFSIFFSYVSDEYTVTEAPRQGLASKRVSIVHSTTPQFKLNTNKFAWEYYQR